MANDAGDKKTCNDHKREYFESSGVMVPGHRPYSALGEWPCDQPDCPATTNRSGRAFCHMFGCNGRPDKKYMEKQSKLQQKWKAEKALTPGAAPYVPPGRRGKAAGKDGANTTAAQKTKELQDVNKKLVAEIKMFKNDKKGSVAGGAPPDKAATNQEVKALEQELKEAKKWAEARPDKPL